MTKIRELAQAFEPKTTKNIADLEKVSVDLDIEKQVHKIGTPDEFEINVVVVDKERYRVPMSVIKQLKEFLEAIPTLKTFKVIKHGEGLTGTSYTVVPLDK